MVDFTGFLEKSVRPPGETRRSPERELGIRWAAASNHISPTARRRFTKIEKMVLTAAKLGLRWWWPRRGQCGGVCTCCEHVRRDGGCPWRGARNLVLPTKPWSYRFRGDLDWISRTYFGGQRGV
ncbi:hypothetical protein HPP92_004437 [Vanilla planifolia]|uniref:Uncharacterized protein n=1 Tax=Vanilla planifolia TaxID=51239 RepID=A0A835RWR3_VANPL|nr:hypothetical protein HPP92_004437 [Vanilla planifolia]